VKWWSKKLSRQKKKRKEKKRKTRPRVRRKNKNIHLMLVISKYGIGNINKKASNYLNLHTLIRQNAQYLIQNFVEKKCTTF
jgi:hypothetical protein